MDSKINMIKNITSTLGLQPVRWSDSPNYQDKFRKINKCINRNAKQMYCKFQYDVHAFQTSAAVE